MLRTANLFDRIHEPENLRLAFHKAARGRRGQAVVQQFACRVGKGREAAILRAQGFTRQAEWFLKLDVRKYFDSVPHVRLLAFLERRFNDRRLLELLHRIITSYRGRLGIGLPIGSLTSQHFANFYLGWLDCFVKESLRVRGQVRYSDDMVLWHASREALVDVHARCEEFAARHLALDFKPGEVRRTILKGSNRVNRGGSWNNDAANCRTANRNNDTQTNRTNNNGFRLTLNSAGKAASALRLRTEQIVFLSDLEKS